MQYVLIPAICALAVIASFVLWVVHVYKKEAKQAKAFVENHKKIRPGMRKSQVIDILGERYTQSYLKNGVEKLEWRYRCSGYSTRVGNGARVYSGSFTRKISVKLKDEIVTEVNSLNMD